MRKQSVLLGIIFCLLGIIIVSGTLLQMTFIIKFENTIFVKNIDISKTGTNYTFNFVDKHGPEKEVLLQFKKTLLPGIDLNTTKPNIIDGKIRVLVKSSNGRMLYNEVISRSSFLVKEYSSEDVSLIIASYSRAFSQNYVIIIDILEGDARYENVEPTLIIRSPPVAGEAGFYFLFLLLAGSISFLIGLGIIIVSIIKK
ncbi:MAG: hypothetical protein WC592_05800 [Candidatus Omnitrophota bacterium]